MAKSRNSGTTVRSVIRALDLLDMLADSGASMGLSQLSEKTSLNGSTVHRLLASLMTRGYVRQDPATKRYHLGPQSLLIGQSALLNLDVRNEAIGPLRELAAQAHELANLALLSGNEAIYIAQAPAEGHVQMFTQLGARVPLHCTGIGKAMLAHLPASEIPGVLGPGALPAFTPNTVTNSLRLQQEFEVIRQRGYALDNEEREVGVRCVAAPVFGASGEVFAAVSISGPAGRITPDREVELGQLVSETAAEISRRLGHRKGAMPAQP